MTKLKGKEPRQVVSVRMEPTDKTNLKKKYGSIQAAIDWLIETTIYKGKKK